MYTYMLVIELVRSVRMEQLDFYTDKYIPLILETHCFTHASVELELDLKTVVLRLHCESKAFFDEYQQKYAPDLLREVVGATNGEIKQIKRYFSKRITKTNTLIEYS